MSKWLLVSLEEPTSRAVLCRVVFTYRSYSYCTCHFSAWQWRLSKVEMKLLN